MATEQDTLPPWQQLQQQQQFQQAPQQEPADLVTYHESDLRPGEDGYEEEAPNIRSEPEPRQNAVVEGDDADLEEKQEEQPDETPSRTRLSSRFVTTSEMNKPKRSQSGVRKKRSSESRMSRCSILTTHGRRPNLLGSVTVLLKPYAKPKTRLGRSMFSN